MNVQDLLKPKEVISWEGRPAPRCYTFRNWKHSIFGLLLLLISTYWQVIGLQLSVEYEMAWLSWLPTPFLLIGFYLALGHLILSRLEWNRVLYLVTDQRILVRRGLFQELTEEMPLDQVTYFCLQPHGKELGSIRIHGDDENSVLKLKCIEYPRKVTGLLEQAMGDKACPVPERPNRLDF